MRPLRASSLKIYRPCPQKWMLKYVDELPEEDKSFFNLGRAVHTALETFYDGRVAAPAPLEETLEAFHEEFDPEAYESEEEATRRRADGVKMVEDFYDKHAPDFDPALAVEKYLTFEVEGVSFRGYVDRIDKVEGDRLRIVGYKAGGSFDLDRVRTEDQLTLRNLQRQRQGRVSQRALAHEPGRRPADHRAVTAGLQPAAAPQLAGEPHAEGVRRAGRISYPAVGYGGIKPGPELGGRSGSWHKPLNPGKVACSWSAWRRRIRKASRTALSF